jgi:hypothetical protein
MPALEVRAHCALPLAACLTFSLAAQDAEPASIGVQARISKAAAGLKDVTGSSLPGLGASLVAEIDYTEGFRAAKSLDVELKLLAGRITPQLTAAAVQLGVTYRFTP